jgi:hypothetical protein
MRLQLHSGRTVAAQVKFAAIRFLLDQREAIPVTGHGGL